MKMLKLLASGLLIQLLVFGTSCAQEKRNHEKHGEEDGTQYTKTQTYNEVKKGVRLILKYDEAQSAFVGTIENKSNETAERARVEVHLSNGVELGPTKPQDIAPGKTITVTLSAKGQDFRTWSTHAEVGSNEHGHGPHGENGEGGEHSHGPHGENGEGGEHGHGSRGESGEHGRGSQGEVD
ncbi:hypothetical protein EYV94_27305 [Puteibacter caeruleilacunae]|nr:hypothetical protein EYV94_27305 [Puteibacter caeruleilacunae]